MTQMTNYNERLDKILDKFFEMPYPDYNMGILPDEDGYDSVQERRNYEESYARDEAKQAITSLIKELVAEAKPAYKTDTRGATQNPNNAFYHTKKAQGYNEAIEDYEQNLLNALEEV